MRCNNRSLKLMRILSLMIVVTCLAVVVAAIFVKNNLTSTKLANQKMEELARDYYENDFYKCFIRDHVAVGQEDNLGQYFKKYTQLGFSPVKLRKLLDYSEKNNKDMLKYFSHDKFSCDTNGSYALIKPKDPYSVKDYEIIFSLKCKEG